jgi:hypothetical protein
MLPVFFGRHYHMEGAYNGIRKRIRILIEQKTGESNWDTPEKVWPGRLSIILHHS